MPQRNTDRSKSRIVTMPKLHDETEPAEIWFEAGMVYFQDPKDRNEVVPCTLEHFREYIDTLCQYVDDEKMLKQFVCGRQALRRFVMEAGDLIREIEPQLHVGLSIETIAEIEASRAKVTRRQGFECSNNGLLLTPGETTRRFLQRESGLIIPQ